MSAGQVGHGPRATRRAVGRLGALLAAAAVPVLLPAVVAAHPLGNFTINHYAGLRVGANSVLVDVVIDQAEIPTFQESTRIDANGDGRLTAQEIEAERLAACPRLAGDLSLTVAGATLALEPVAAGLSFPLGASGAATMRLVCEYAAAVPSPLAGPTPIRFEDRSNADRIGWREVIVAGDGTKIESTLPSTSASERLTRYPADLLAQPLDVRVALLTARPGGPTLAPWSAPDATPLAGAVAGGMAANGRPGAAASGGVAGDTPASGAAAPIPAGPPARGAAAAAAPAPAAVPGGVAGEIAGLLGASELTPIALVLSFLTAVLLGAGHALTPGHGKTIMAAYLVGTKGTARHALGLGLATAISHTIGVLLLALLIVFAGSALPADRVYPVLTAASGIIVVAIGAWLLATQVTRWIRVSRRGVLMPNTAGPRAGRASHADAPLHEHEHGHGHADEHDHSVAGAAAMTRPAAAKEAGMHRHGWRVHSHEPAHPAETSLSWRSLVALGLSGGLVPSTNALLILVATLAVGRAAYGVVLVMAFGLGMAAVLVGVGLALVYASGFLARVPHRPALGGIVAFAPTGAAVAVLVLGLYLTAQAIGGRAVL